MYGQTSQIRQLPVLESVPEVKYENRQRLKILFFNTDYKSEKSFGKFKQ